MNRSLHHSRALAVAALGLGLAACGSSSTPSSTGSGGAKANGSPIVVGIANNEGQSVSIPEYRYGAEAAIKYINAQGGVNGHPIKEIKCIDDGSPEGAVNCANTFIQGHAVTYFAGVDNGADAAIPVLKSANVPYVTENPWGALQRTSPDAFALTAGDSAFFAAPPTALAQVGAKSVAYFSYSIPTTEALVPIAKQFAQAKGIKLTVINVSPTNADWTSAVAAAQAAHVDAMWGILQEGDCTNMVRAARSSGFKGSIAVGSCSAYVSALGSQAANTLGVWPLYFPQVAASAPTAVQGQIKSYEAAMKADGHADDENGYATASFSAMMELSEVLKGIPGDITGPSVLTALSSANVPGFLGPNADCAAKPFGSVEPSACNAKVLLYKVVAAGGGVTRQLLQPGYLDTAAH